MLEDDERRTSMIAADDEPGRGSLEAADVEPEKDLRAFDEEPHGDDASKQRARPDIVDNLQRWKTDHPRVVSAAVALLLVTLGALVLFHLSLGL